MNAPPQFDTLPLLAAKAGLDAALDKLGEALERYFAAGEDAAVLRQAITELQGIRDVVQSLSLDGVAVYCGELEKLLQELAAGMLQLAPPQQAAIQNALFELAHYLDALAEGAPNTALRLFGRYQEILQLRGIEAAFEVDLFFPELAVDLPAWVREVPLEQDVAARIRVLRSEYQQALLKWLQGDAAGTLQAMRSAVRGAMACAPVAQRAFWWVAGGLLDCLVYDGLPAELNARKMLGRIDLQMKALAGVAQPEARATLCEMLYLVARSEAVSDTVDEIRQVYDLDAYLSGEPLLPPGETGLVLEQLRTLLKTAEETWEACVHEVPGTCRKFAGQAAELHALSERLDRHTLQFLCRQIHGVAGHAGEPGCAQRVALDMAMALLLLNGGVEHYSRLGSGFHRQVRILGQRMQDAMSNGPEDNEALGQLVQLQRQMEEREVMALLAGEMQDNLQRVEQGWKDFFGHPDRRDGLPHLGQLLAEVRGGLHMLSLDTAEQLAGALQQAAVRHAAGIMPAAADGERIAAAASALEAYAHELTYGRKPDGAMLAEALRGMPQAQQEAPSPANEPAAAVVPPSGAEDELLEVFIEEAQEVLETLRASLDACGLNPDQKTLAAIRRGFHTLKGSGRMVGLGELGEAAWAVERAINKWLQENRRVTPSLLNFIGQAERQFQDWVDTLQGKATATVDTAGLVGLAHRIEAGGEPLEPADAGLPAATPASPEQPATVQPATVEPAAVEGAPPAGPEPGPGAQPNPDVVAVGSISLSPILFKIATEEAENHMAGLRRQLAALDASDPPLVAYDFVRAAHTLAGINRTMGFLAVEELAYALEAWLEARIGKPFRPGAEQLELLEQTVAVLGEMCRAIREDRREPQPQPALIARLQAERDRLDAAPAGGPGSRSPKTAMPAPAARSRQLVEMRAVQDDIDEQLLPIFLEEADELYPKIVAALQGWRERPGEASAGNRLQRLLHTLKGSARMAGVMRVGDLIHRMEDRVVAGMAQRDPELWEELDAYLDRIGGVLDQLRSGEPEEQPAEPVAGVERPAAVMLRVRPDTIDHLVNEAGEISVTRARVETGLRAFRSGLLDLGDSVNRLRRQLREIEIQAESQMEARSSLPQDMAERFDPLEFDRFTRFQELTRFMNESVHDVQTVQHGLLRHLDEAAAALATQAHLSHDLQQGLMAVRMVPFSSISERLYRIVRQTGKELGKKANLELAGSEVELDRSVLERMVAPLEHLLRNAIAHGLESPQQRESLGKPPIGEIRLAAGQESNEVVFEFGDDGAGLDLDGLRRNAAKRGLLREGEQVSDEQAMQLIFVSGVSTAAEVTEIYGRGIGMDVVRSEITALGGRIDVSSERGKGTHFRIHLPLTLAVTQVLVVRAGADEYAIPSTMVEQALQARHDMLEEAYREGHIGWHGRSYPLRYLPHLLGDGGRIPESRQHNPVLLLRSGEQRMALHVDELQGNQEAVVKNIGPQLARLPGIAGATVLGGGGVVLILNPVVLNQRMPSATQQAAPAAETRPLQARPLVMVVDDSLTVRKITSRMLSRAGYEVVTAKDGVDALEQLTQVVPAVILLDIEMPRMDGFEFTRQLRRDPGTRHLPIIMITSRTADKHRNYALELGVNAYFGKPYQEAELLQQIADFTGLPEAG